MLLRQANKLCSRRLPWTVCAAALLALGQLPGCEEDGLGSNPDFDVDIPGDGDAGGDPSRDAGSSDELDCFTNPTTHFELINACTDAVRVVKSPELAGLADDGSLPPLP